MNALSGSVTDAIAAIAIETGISPVDLLATPPPIWEAMMRYLDKRAKDRERAQRKR